MGRLFRERDILGVRVLYIQNNKARAAKKVVVTGRTVWVLLPDGRIGCNDVDYFKWAYVGINRRDVWAAEALWRLGAIKKDAYQKVVTAQKKHEEKKNREYAADDFKSSAQRLGIKLTAAQQRAVA